MASGDEAGRLAWVDPPLSSACQSLWTVHARSHATHPVVCKQAGVTTREHPATVPHLSTLRLHGPFLNAGPHRDLTSSIFLLYGLYTQIFIRQSVYTIYWMRKRLSRSPAAWTMAAGTMPLLEDGSALIFRTLDRKRKKEKIMTEDQSSAEDTRSKMDTVVRPSFRNDKKLSFFQPDITITQFQEQFALDHQKELIFPFVSMPEQLAFQLRKKDIGVIQLPNNFRSPILHELCEFLSEANFLHEPSPFFLMSLSFHSSPAR